MTADEIRRRFLDFFEQRGHAVRPSSPLVPAEDPTLLFTNAGMVQFKKAFLGQEKLGFVRATTSQKCVRAGGKHNDLEEVGQTARHHTFFEMLGNFSFGDYFKRDAIRFAWDLLVGELGLDPERIFITVHHSDEDAAKLWSNEVGVDPRRIHRLGDKDNFWQMAETGPCGPCSEIHYDLRPAGARGLPTTDELVDLAHKGQVVELWNLVFMQFDRDEKGTLKPLPAPSIDTGAGLERLAAVLQGVDSNFHTDLFRPLLDRIATEVRRPYDPSGAEAMSYRVLADHARAVAFLLADGVFPSNDGRGYVLRRILRRAVRYAWLLGRREPTLVHVVESVVDTMSGTYPELSERRKHLLRITREEEERFLTTIEGGLSLFDQLAPPRAHTLESATIAGEDAFRLYDTHGFPIDLTELMARERGYQVDVAGFEQALDAQRARSRADRARTIRGVAGTEGLEAWTVLETGAEQRFVGYETSAHDTNVLAYRVEGDQASLVLRENPFYVEGGGQVSDHGTVAGDGWSLSVERARRIEGWTAVSGPLIGSLPKSPPVRARATIARARHDTERNHTATHLLHAALRAVLGEHVVQRGSLVEPGRLRFDFAHGAPMSEAEKRDVERRVNEAVWADHPVRTELLSYPEAVGRGAMALFGEKYGDVVRMVAIPGVSLELCGGTHVRHTGEIGLLKIVAEGGVAAGVRRIEAVTGPGAMRYFEEIEARQLEAAGVLRTTPDHLAQRARQLLEERAELERMLVELRKGGGGGEAVVHEVSVDASGGAFDYRAIRLKVRDADDARAWGDAFLGSGKSGVAVVAAEAGDGKHSLFGFVSDDLIRRGVRADLLIREVAGRVGGKGGGRPHMAQGGVADPTGLDDALVSGEAVVRRLAGASAA
ncbi:MAG: alanine--tRNA ligase [Gemmatimonadetes bacterium]|nr:alanine--tRNA ligase [Gemmatimonadota bacterium]